MRSRRDDRRSTDAGLSLIEVLVSLSLIGMAAAAFTVFFVSMMAVAGGQSTRQTGIQLADRAVEQVRALKGAALTTGRDQQSTQLHPPPCRAGRAARSVRTAPSPRRPPRPTPTPRWCPAPATCTAT